MARKPLVTADGVNLGVIDVGDRTKPALLFVHGLSQSAPYCSPQFTSAALLAKYRLVAVDLRGHGHSQGAYGAIDDRGNALPPLTSDRCVSPSSDLVTRSSVERHRRRDRAVRLSQFVQLALSDTVVGRAVASREEVVAATTYDIQLTPAAREAIVLRQFDHRPFLAALPAASKARVLVLTGLSDQVIQAATTGPYVDTLGLSRKRFVNEGHAFFACDTTAFNAGLLAFVG